MTDRTEVTPPWGYSPIERYLLTNWSATTSSSSLPSSSQRQALVRAYLASDSYLRNIQPTDTPDFSFSTHFEEHPSITPTEAQINEILAPWRSATQREVAIACGTGFDVVWLRTCYSEGSEAKYRRILDDPDLDLAMAFGDDKFLLDDARLYDFGEEWRKVLDVLPEMVVKPELRELIQSEREKSREMVAGASEEERELVLEWRRLCIQELHVSTYIIVVDEEALETGLLLFAFLDAHGEVVRQVRLEPGVTQEVSGGWFGRGGWQSYFEEGIVGRKYEPDSEEGRSIYF
jgi:hypothetical protein